MKAIVRIWCVLGALTILLASNYAYALSGDDIPAIYSNIVIENGEPKVLEGKKKLSIRKQSKPKYTLTMLRGNPVGTGKGFRFTFFDPDHNLSLEKGTLFYSLWDSKGARFPMPKYRFEAPISNRSAFLNMSSLRGKFDCSGWEKSGKGTLYYRVAGKNGEILYEGKFSFKGNGPFRVGDSIIEGPWICKVNDTGATIAFETNRKIAAEVTVNKETGKSSSMDTWHEIDFTSLTPDTTYDYTVRAGDHEETYSFRTAPAPSSRTRFVFAYGSDCKQSIPSGERDMRGVNAYIMKKAMAIASAKNAAFFQLTGDVIGGGQGNIPDQRVEYANFKRAILPWASRLPLFVGMGNHESLNYIWEDGTRKGLRCDRFPFATASAEAIFAREFVLPANGPVSEDGAKYDPNPDRGGDFPTYRENVYYYTWDNVAMLVLNSHYLYATPLPYDPTIGGNLGSYIMDNQLAWLKQSLDRLQADRNIDHVFVTHHTPLFPNGGHVKGCRSMWFDGCNSYRPIIKGAAANAFEGAIDRRDAYLKMLLDHGKVKVVLAGHEHNYSRMIIRKGMPIYDPAKYIPARPLEIDRPIWQIVNGAVGASYHAKVDAPWNRGYPETESYLKKFSTQHALVFFHVHGKSLEIEVINPDTLELIERFDFSRNDPDHTR
ncbi:MAG: metallophosphoesterase family protein [Pseudomonadota bacterium]